MKGLFKKGAVIGGLLATTAGVAFAAIVLTFLVSSNNTVTSANANLQVTAMPLNLSGLVQGGSTPPSAFTIKNTGAYTGNVTLNVTEVEGDLCPHLTYNIGGDASGSLNPLEEGTIDLGTVDPGETLNLTHSVTMSNSGPLNQPCTWDLTATFTSN